MNFTRYIISVLIIWITCSTASFAQQQTLDAYLKTDEITKGAVLKVRDPQIYGSGGYISDWQNRFRIESNKNALELFLNPDSKDFGDKAFEFSVRLKLTYMDENNNVVQNDQGKDTTEVSLNVNYDLSSKYQNKKLFRFNDGHKVYVKVADVVINGADSSALTNVVYLRTSMSIKRHFKMTNREVSHLKHSYRSNSNELFVRWNDKKGAAYYDLEWTWVDNYDERNGNFIRLSPSQVPFDFDQNSQRVRISGNSYKLPVVYEEGYLVYRVRPLAKTGKEFNKVIPGPWSLPESDDVSNADPHYYKVSSSVVHQRDKMNWMYQASFTEAGRKKAIVDYFDGLNYNRQRVQQLQTDQNVLISETLYDYYGRDAVKVLPAPVAKKKYWPALKYYDNFNRNAQGNPYSKEDFDRFAECSQEARPMSQSSGAAKYYSSSNQMNSLHTSYLPEANGYPFVQKQYYPDRSGRERKIGNVGEVFQPGNGHSIQQFYGTPSQVELDRLFGSDVGYARHYQKEIKVNENGQLQVSYIDNKDNVIAGALAGDKPQNLQALPDDQVETKTITQDLLNAQRWSDNTLMAAENIAVATEGSQYSFSYKLKPSSFQRVVCEGESICYDGLYNLVINLTDDCGNIVKDTSIQIGDLTSIDEQCNEQQEITVSFNSGPLSVGSYEITKRLSINQQAFERYLDYFENKSCIQEEYEKIYKENQEEIDTLSCESGCGGTESISREYTYTTEDGETRTGRLTDEEYQQLKDKQKRLCGSVPDICAGSYDAMLRDMSPSGQYALYYDSISQGIKPSVFPLSVLNTSNKLPFSKANWRNPSSVYRNASGDTAYIALIEMDDSTRVFNQDSIFVRNNKRVIRPENLLDVSDFIKFWQDSWAIALVSYHPEYGYYLFCRQNPESNYFDGKLLSVNSYQKALDSNYVSASGDTYLLKNDPYFTANPQLKTEMKNKMQDFVDIQGQYFSLEEIVIAMHNGCALIHCSPGSVNLNKLNNCITQHSPLFQNKSTQKQDQEWTSYRSIYMSLKNKIMHRERHQYAINRGNYNICIGSSENGDDISSYSEFTSDFNVPNGFNSSRSCFSNASAYAGKVIRFPDGSTLYRSIKGLSKVSDAAAQAEQLENYVDQQMKANCDKCPIEMDLETLLNGLLQNGLTQNQDATKAVSSCDIKNQLNAGNQDAFQWKVNVSGRELTGNLYAGTLNVCTIKLCDTAKIAVNWDSILMLTCLQHVDKTVNYGGNKRTFKVRAITKNYEVVWLEGTTSCIDLTNCDIEKFCTPNAIAGDLDEIFDRVFGFYPELRKILLDQGYQAVVDQYMPVYQNSNLVAEVFIPLTDRLKQQHVSPVRRNGYVWKVDTLTSNQQKLTAGIYGPKKIEKCLFDFEILDQSKSFAEPFIVTDILLNHPAIEQNNCDPTSFVLEVRTISLNVSQLTGNNTNVDDVMNDLIDLGEPFYIKVNNNCYEVGECCPESDCPDIAKNGDFEKGHKDFRSDLPPYSKNKQNYYSIQPGKQKSLLNQINSSDLQKQGKLNQINYSNQTYDALLDKKSEDTTTSVTYKANDTLNIIPYYTVDTSANTVEKTQQLYKYKLPIDSQRYIVNQEIQNQTFTISDLNLNLGNDMLFRQSINLQKDLNIGNEQLKELNNVLPVNQHYLDKNHYLIFNMTNSKAEKVWKQKLKLEPGKTYLFEVMVKSLNVAKPDENNAERQFSLLKGNTKHKLKLKEIGSGYQVLTGTFTADKQEKTQLGLQYDPAAVKVNYDNHKWQVDNIRIKAQTCEKPGCCPPLFPKLPADAIENPCKARKEMIAEANTEREFRRFLEDTLTSVSASMRNAFMSFEEIFTMTYADNYYAYTLYYYDQAGNLVKTVPPKGFNPLDQSEINQVQEHREQGTGSPVYPAHELFSTYEFNSRNQIIREKSPDRGIIKYYHDKLGMLVAKQDAQQRSDGNIYNYYFYDAKQRETESGVVKALKPLTYEIAMNQQKFERWVRNGQRSDVKYNYYDQPLNQIINNYFPDGQQHLRNRMATVAFERTFDNNPATFNFATHYSYDAMGNVNYVVKENNDFTTKHQVKKIKYDYDRISGKINKLVYQPGKKDQFIQKYDYDADNRLTSIKSSRYGYIWDEEAKFYYYPHGPVARVELGEEKVQGIDQAYTLQGWLKGINSSGLSSNKDIGGDGKQNTLFANVAPDVSSMTFDYYNGDYEPVSGSNPFYAHLNNGLNNSSPNQYNGRIRQSVIHNAAFPDKTGMARAYRYDQLGRLVQSEAYTKSGNIWSKSPGYHTSYQYDANGNIISLERFARNSLMDDLNLHYKPDNNQLVRVTDQINDQEFDNDIDNQQQGNYSYDYEGKLIKDQSAGLLNIRWSGRDLIRHVTKSGGQSIYYDYDASGQRIMKTIDAPGREDDKVIYYVRGADDKILAEYEYQIQVDSTFISDYHIQGNKRIGLINMDTTLESMSSQFISQIRGRKQYSIKDHLDNVLMTVSDRKIRDTSQVGASRFIAQVKSATSYYPYGSSFSDRRFGSEKYDFGFQGKQRDDELKGHSNSYYFEKRMYDSRLGRWLSVDPMTKEMPNLSAYMAMSGDPINREDPDGAEDMDKVKKSIDYGNIIWGEVTNNVVQLKGVMESNSSSNKVYGFNSALNQMRDISRKWTNLSGGIASKSVDDMLHESGIGMKVIFEDDNTKAMAFTQIPENAFNGLQQLRHQRNKLKQIRKQAAVLNDLALVELVRDNMDIKGAAENYISTGALDAVVFKQARRNFGYTKKNIDKAISKLDKAIAQGEEVFLEAQIKQGYKELKNIENRDKRDVYKALLDRKEKLLEKVRDRNAGIDWENRRPEYIE